MKNINVTGVITKHQNNSTTKNPQLVEILFKCEECDHESTKTHLHAPIFHQCDKWNQKGSPKNTFTGPKWKDQI